MIYIGNTTITTAKSADYLGNAGLTTTHIHRRYLSQLPGVTLMQSSFALRTVVETTAVDI